MCSNLSPTAGSRDRREVSRPELGRWPSLPYHSKSMGIGLNRWMSRAETLKVLGLQYILAKPVRQPWRLTVALFCALPKSLESHVCFRPCMTKSSHTDALRPEDSQVMCSLASDRLLPPLAAFTGDSGS
jgi:hypothetical protein